MEAVSIRCGAVDDGRLTLSVVGELDATNADRLSDAITHALVDLDVRSVVVDLSGLEFIDSGGLGVLVVGHRLATSHGASLRVTGSAHEVLRLMQITGTLDLLQGGNASSSEQGTTRPSGAPNLLVADRDG